MLDSSLSAPTLAWPSEAGWEVARLLVDFVLDVSLISRGQGDLLDPLILTAILEANQAAVRHDPGLMTVYGDAQSALPDELRRPISINAVAASLRLPFESVRRRVQVWLRSGLCAQGEGGVYVPAAVATSPAYLAVQAARVERLARLEHALAEAGLHEPPIDPRPWSEVVRAADRALGGYMLRTCDQLIELTGGPVYGYVFLGLCAANLRGVSGGDIARAAPRLLTALTPATVRTVSAQLGMPAETARRRLHALEGLGFAERHAGRWISVAPASKRPQVLQMLAGNAVDLRRLLATIAEVRARRGV